MNSGITIVITDIGVLDYTGNVVGEYFEGGNPKSDFKALQTIPPKI